MTGESFREQLRRPEGHFSTGAIVSASGRRMIQFQVDFTVTLDGLQLLNHLRHGIRYCEQVHMSKSGSHTILLQIASGVSENEAIRIALAYRSKVNAQYQPMLDRATAQREAAHKAAPAQPSSTSSTDRPQQSTSVVFIGE